MSISQGNPVAVSGGALKFLTSAGVIFLGFVFGLSGLSKVADISQFANFVFIFDLPEILAKAVIFVVSGMELALSMFFLSRVEVSKTAGASIIFLSLASVALLYLFIKGLHVSCACFSDTINNFFGFSGGWAIGRNVGLIAIAFFVFKNSANR